MSFFEELTKKATGLLADIKGTTDDGTSSANLQSMFQNADTRQYGQRQKPISSSPLDVTKFGYTGIDRMARGNDASEKLKNQLTLPENRDKEKINISKYGEQKVGIGENQFKKIFGLSYSDVAKNWKDKGGFEGLMANPGFTLGLAIMQSSAQGRPISESLLQNVLASGEISSAYADRIKARSKVLAPITADQRAEVEAVFAEDNYFGPDLIDRAKKGNQQAKFREATDMVYDRANKLAKEDAKGGKEVRLDRGYFRKALNELISEGKINKRKPSFGGIRSGTVEAVGGIDGARAEGGPVEANKNYLVGEKGPEVFVPQVDGNIINNDDAKVVNMLLEHNPQLKNISRARAVKILKNRFPDYF